MPVYAIVLAASFAAIFPYVWVTFARVTKPKRRNYDYKRPAKS